MKTRKAFFILIFLFILCEKNKKSRKKICIFEKNKYNSLIIDKRTRQTRPLQECTNNRQIAKDYKNFIILSYLLWQLTN